MGHPRVGVFVCDVRRVPAFVLPDEAVEFVHAVGAWFDGARGVAVGAVGFFAEGEQPREAGFAFGTVVEELAVVEILLGVGGDDGEVVEVGHPDSSAWGRLFGLVSPSKMDGEASGVIAVLRRCGRVLCSGLV